MDIEKLREQYLTEVKDSSYLDYTGVKSEQYVQWLEQKLVKLFAIPVVSKPKGTFVPNEVKIPKEPRPIDMNTKYLRDKMLGTNDC